MISLKPENKQHRHTVISKRNLVSLECNSVRILKLDILKLIEEDLNLNFL